MAEAEFAGPAPALFIGHGSPSVALEDTQVTRAWRAMALSLPRPRAILAISAHWFTQGTAVTAMARPKTIHDFGGFPPEMYQIQYPAPGDPDLALRVAQLLAPTPVHLDVGEWGLDHGTWTVLMKAYPDADVPVVQLSIDRTKPPAFHFEMGRKLARLRDEGVMILGTGNVVHNLGVMDWQARYGPAHPWATRFHDFIRSAIETDRPEAVVGYEALGQDAHLAQPNPDHYYPLLYVLGARRPSDRVSIGPEHIEYKSISMLSAVFESEPARAAA